jgi:hypothetical protein
MCEAGVPGYVSVLRSLDVILWSYATSRPARAGGQVFGRP